uniref:Uncharacterized protein n=1 Tax=Ditylenchus dipsaci TaxID=166011 RepID=A0A915DMC4_9BILA
MGQRCDGKYDCVLEEDEQNCPMCKPSEFACIISEQCIPMSQRCNGVAECQDGTDEHDCEDCGKESFTVANRGNAFLPRIAAMELLNVRTEKMNCFARNHRIECLCVRVDVIKYLEKICVMELKIVLTVQMRSIVRRFRTIRNSPVVSTSRSDNTTILTADPQLNSIPASFLELTELSTGKQSLESSTSPPSPTPPVFSAPIPPQVASPAPLFTNSLLDPEVEDSKQPEMVEGDYQAGIGEFSPAFPSNLNQVVRSLVPMTAQAPPCTAVDPVKLKAQKGGEKDGEMLSKVEIGTGVQLENIRSPSGVPTATTTTILPCIAPTELQ